MWEVLRTIYGDLQVDHRAQLHFPLLGCHVDEIDLLYAEPKFVWLPILNLWGISRGGQCSNILGFPRFWPSFTLPSGGSIKENLVVVVFIFDSCKFLGGLFYLKLIVKS